MTGLPRFMGGKPKKNVWFITADGDGVRVLPGHVNRRDRTFGPETEQRRSCLISTQQEAIAYLCSRFGTVDVGKALERGSQAAQLAVRDWEHTDRDDAKMHLETYRDQHKALSFDRFYLCWILKLARQGR